MIGDELTRPGESHYPGAPRPAGTEPRPILGHATTLGSDAAMHRAGTDPPPVVGTATTLGSAAAMQRGAPTPTPTRVGRYYVLEGLGAGGMGVILAAYDPELDRRVAVKLLRAGPGPLASARLLREAQALARVSHPNVVQIHDTGVQDDQVFLAMELVDGVNLRVWLDEGPRPWRTILRVFVEAGRGLAAAHAAGIVHRDFKPENVLIGRDGRARVADFGLARQVAETSDVAATEPVPSTSLAASLTASGAILGTPAYMSPEQFAGTRADERSDLFSFCVALYEALYRRRPFAGDDLPTLVGNMLSGRVQDPPAGPVPRTILALLRRGLAHAPAARPASMEALLAGLTYDPSARRNRWLVAAGLATAASGLTAALTLATPRAAASVCTAEDTLVDLWNPDVKAALADKIAAVVASPAARAHVDAGLDAYARDWQAARHDACIDHHRGGESDAVFDARTRCLDRRRSALDGALRLLRDARPGDDVARVIAGLPAIDACARVDELLAEPARDPALVAAVQPLLDDARALADAGRFADAAAATRTAVDLAAGDRGLLGLARLADGRREMMRDDSRAATAALRLALADAVAARDDRTAGEAVARLLYARAQTDRERPDEILADAPLAHALVDRQGPDSFARRRLLANLAVVNVAAGDLATARVDIAAATAGLAAVVDADPLESANFLQTLATMTDDPARRAEAFDEAGDLLARVLGEDHPDLLGLHWYRGRTAIDLDEAREHVAAACAGTRRAFPEPDPRRDRECTQCGLLLGALARESDDLTAAQTQLNDAATCPVGAPKTPEEEFKISYGRDLAAAHAALLRGQFEPAIAAAERAAATLATYATPERWWLELERADAWYVAGAARLARGDRPAARADLEKSHEVLARVADKQPFALAKFQRARVATSLADVLWDDPGERPRARTLALAARAFHAARGPAGAANTAALDTWLSGHPTP